MKTTKSKIRCGGILTILVLRSELLRRVALVLALGLMVCLVNVSNAAPMGTAFTYQGRLIDANSVAEGLYDFQFKLFDDANTITGIQQGATIDVNDLDVIDGYFTVELDLGSDVFDGSERWLDIGVRPGASTGSFTTLSPRQEITPVPYALQTRGIFVDDVRYIDYPNTWTAKESYRWWLSVAMSADGTKQTAVVWTGRIYVSTDSGNTWTAKESNRYWHSVAMSADGTKQTAVVDIGGRIYVSTDSGNTWTAKESNRNWQSVAMSADGTKQTAVVWNGQIYVSMDSGNTWTAKGSNRGWYSVAMSADGTKQTAVVWNGQIYVSMDSGNTWTAKESNRNWQSVAMSADGTKQTAVVDNGQIYVSMDSGNTWTAKGSNRDWYSVAMSADGTKQTAVVNMGQIYVSTDSGNTWTAKESNRGWYSVAMSADGTKQTAVVFNGQIYVCSADVGFDYNVGVGTTSPHKRLHVAGNAGILLLEGTDHAYIEWYPDGYEAGRKAYAGFEGAATDYYTITNEIPGGNIILKTNEGNVGIGTTSPAYKLDVSGDIRATGTIRGTLANNSVTSAMIVDNTITQADIATNGVGAAEIATDAVGSAQIAANAVGASEIAEDAVGASEIAANAVGASEIVENAVGNSEVAQDSSIVRQIYGRLNLGESRDFTFRSGTMVTIYMHRSTTADATVTLWGMELPGASRFIYHYVNNGVLGKGLTYTNSSNETLVDNGYARIQTMGVYDSLRIYCYNVSIDYAVTYLPKP